VVVAVEQALDEEQEEEHRNKLLGNVYKR